MQGHTSSEGLGSLLSGLESEKPEFVRTLEKAPAKAFTCVFVTDRVSGDVLLGWKKSGTVVGLFDGFGGAVSSV